MYERRSLQTAVANDRSVVEVMKSLLTAEMEKHYSVVNETLANKILVGRWTKLCA